MRLRERVQNIFHDHNFCLLVLRWPDRSVAVPSAAFWVRGRRRPTRSSWNAMKHLASVFSPFLKSHTWSLLLPLYRTQRFSRFSWEWREYTRGSSTTSRYDASADSQQHIVSLLFWYHSHDRLQAIAVFLPDTRRFWDLYHLVPKSMIGLHEKRCVWMYHPAKNCYRHRPTILVVCLSSIPANASASCSTKQA